MQKTMKAKPAKITEFATESIDARLLLKVLSDFKRGDFTTRLPSEQTGITGKIYDALNEVIDLNDRMATEFDRVATVVGKEGRIKQRAALSTANGSWGACIDSVNTLIADLVQPTTEVARVIGAVAKGDLSQTMALEIEGRPLTGEFLRNHKIDHTRDLHAKHPHSSSAHYRRGHNGGGSRRSIQEDHGRRERRNPRIEKHHQHHGGPAFDVCFGMDARRA